MSVIFTENPENDLWRELLQFTYEANIKRYLDKKGISTNEEMIYLHLLIKAILRAGLPVVSEQPPI